MTKRVSDSVAIHDPYAGNTLIDQLGPIRSRQEAAKVLVNFPPLPPKDISPIPRHVRLHMLMDIRDLHVPSMEELRLYETMDMMIRQNYHHLNPSSPGTWSMISGEEARYRPPVTAPTYGAAVVGISGSGKTQAIRRCLTAFPQIIEHTSFFRMVSGLQQVVWLSLDVPAGGKATDLAAALMTAWKKATGSSRFDKTLAGEWRNGPQMLDEWRQIASSHFLGLLHLDEIQNLFKLPTLKIRSRKKPGELPPELRVIDDQSLKWILTALNEWQIPLLVSGTPDGFGALTKRLSNTERIVTSGYHSFKHFSGDHHEAFRRHFLPRLGNYQYVSHPLPITEELGDLILKKTAGVQRLIIALWIAAHRVAFERNDDDLRLEDFRIAADTYLSPVAPAVAALHSNDPGRLSMYEDLSPQDHSFWTQFWSNVSRQ
ncbi:AAA family ATPase [Delftia lacustris]|uniref:AAA family ATPase n=1 Tax=Delftia lacustris TaxID=558537 RepID=UPI00064089A2|nr:AAA family ATPase [Delftia lacustris]